MQSLSDFIRTIPDFPKEGVGFKDITTLIRDADAFRAAVDLMAAKFEGSEIDLVVGIESRGFIFGAAIAYRLGTGLEIIRKRGKLPAETVAETYALEYGTDLMEMHTDAIRKGQSVLLVDDLLATGGTMEAAVRLVEGLGGKIAGIVFLIELTFLDGRRKLGGHSLHSLIQYDSDM